MAVDFSLIPIGNLIALFSLTAFEIIFMLLYMFTAFLRKHSLISKTICSLLFLCIGIAAVLARGDTTPYSWRMLLGLMFGVFGDFFLERKKTFLLGSISFATGHIFYARAFLHGFGDELEGLAIPIIICYAVIWTGFFIYFKKREICRNGQILQLPGYCLALLFMLVTAWFRGGSLLTSGNIPQALCLMLGSILFVISDTYLFTAMFSRHKVKHSGKKVHLTYFPAQTLLALSIFFAK